jgi:hypothetical protein
MMVRASVSGSNGTQDAALWSRSFCEDELRGLWIVNSGVGKEAKVKFDAAL